jgi:transglycosylase-like protein
MTVLLVAFALAGTPDHSDYPGCRTRSCEHRMTRQAHGKTKRRWRAFARPYRAWLARTRACESGSNYGTNTGNGYSGAYQFDRATWQSVGGEGDAYQAEPAEQDYRAVVLLKRRGTAPWPVCG